MRRMKKAPKSKLKFIRNIFITLVFLAIIVFVIKIAPDYSREDMITDKINLVINNNDVTKNLKNDLYVENDVVYISKEDIKNFFDNYIYYDEKYNQIITTSSVSVATIEVGKNVMYVNNSEVKIYGTVIKRKDTFYLPFSELAGVYNIELKYIENSDYDVVTIDSLDRKLVSSYASKNLSVKYKKKVLSRTIDKVEKGEGIVVINESDDGWTEVRTDEGKMGYIKSKDLVNTLVVREDLNLEKQISGPINMVWDYYSEYVTAPKREGTSIEGINVVSPSLFTLVKSGNGELIDNVGEDGENYIKWAKENNYKIWAMISNNSLRDTTSVIINDYKLRQILIQNILDNVIKYKLDGVNIDFENINKEDKDMYSRLIIELKPRLAECGLVLSVDVTAPDGGDTWSLCFDRYTLAYRADYIVFMAYDQHGNSSTSAGTVSGYDWVEKNIKKFLGQEGVKPEKLILGLPFYTRLWSEDSSGKLNSSVVEMRNIENVLPTDVPKTWLEDVKQNYSEYNKANKTYKMWIEDEDSIKEKVSLIKQYNLAGVAFWEKDMEINSIWSSISEKLE